MLKDRKDILTLDDWIEAFSHVGTLAVKDDSKVTLWAQSNKTL